MLVGDREGTDWQEAKSPRSCNNRRRKRGEGGGPALREDLSMKKDALREDP